MKTAAIAAGVFCWFAGTVVHAQITSIGPFAGTLSEGWETFPTYSAGYLPNPTAIMGGAALITHGEMAVYHPSGMDVFGLDANVNAGVHDGTHGMGVDDDFYPVQITFLSPVTDFGAYWGALAESPDMEIEFYGTDGLRISIHHFRYSATGPLEWRGWHSTVPIASLYYGGSYVAIDGLQAIPVPRLRLSRVGRDTAQIAWTTNSSGYILESADELPAAVWTPVTNTVSVTAGDFSVTVDLVAAQRAYRLRKP